MIILDATDESIVAVLDSAPASTNPQFNAAYADSSSTSITEAGSEGNLNGTTEVTLVSAPSSGYRRLVKSISIYNRDTSAVIVTVKKKVSSNYYTLIKRALYSGDTLYYSDRGGWSVIECNPGIEGLYRNIIINGDFKIWQRGTSFTPSSGTLTFTADRFFLFRSTSNSLTVDYNDNADVGDIFRPFGSMKITSNGAETVDADDRAMFGQYIEGYNYRRLVGKYGTLSFWVKSSVTGTYCISFKNEDGSRCYVVEYTINQANTWEYKTVTVLFNASGTWNVTNGWGLFIQFCLVAGSNWKTSTINSWISVDKQASNNQVNFMNTSGNVFEITAVQLEVGQIATHFENRLYQTELALCQRYYVKWGHNDTNFYWGWLACYETWRNWHIFLPVPIRTPNPSISVVGNFTPANIRVGYYCQSIHINFDSGNTNTSYYIQSCTVDAEL
jgi:hypothetical protein